jgi:hypothetical protein
MADEQNATLKGRGGQGRGGGRKLGSVNRLAKDAIVAAKETGMLPHEWLLGVARGDSVEQKRWKIQYDKETGEEISRELITETIYPEFPVRMDAAKAAAPFYAPRLATQTVSVQGGNEAVAEALKMMAQRLPV